MNYLAHAYLSFAVVAGCSFIAVCRLAIRAKESVRGVGISILKVSLHRCDIRSDLRDFVFCLGYLLAVLCKRLL